jgi:hypothetical protein
MRPPRLLGWHHEFKFPRREEDCGSARRVIGLTYTPNRMYPSPSRCLTGLYGLCG